MLNFIHNAYQQCPQRWEEKLNSKKLRQYNGGAQALAGEKKHLNGVSLSGLAAFLSLANAADCALVTSYSS